MTVRATFRAFPRRPVALEARVSGLSGDHLGRVTDLGLEGAGLDLDGPLVAEQPVTLMVTAPQLWDPLVLGATVRWCRPAVGERWRAGVRFRLGPPRTLRSLVVLLAEERFE